MEAIRLRDIRGDLRERLAALDGAQCDAIAEFQEAAERLHSSHREKIEKIEGERAAIKQLLEIEERRALALPSLSKTPPLVALQDFLISKIAMYGPLNKDELRAAAEEAGYEGGRTLHTTLMNITKGGRLHQHRDGRYAIPSLDREPLFNLEEKEGEMR
jgi:hypothetical protein